MCLVAFTAGAQTMYEAISYSDYNYVGTARSMAMGNALTAVGGDLGSVGINPAGSAVAGYSQITITPGLSISTMGAAYSAIGGSDVFGDVTKQRNTRFGFPNGGIVVNFDTGRKYGIRNMAFGIVINGTNTYNETFSTGGTQHDTSFMGESAYYTNGVNPDVLDGSSAYNSGVKWTDVLNYRTGIIAYEDLYNDYIGSTEKRFPDETIGLCGPIYQEYYRQRKGAKQDIIMNAAFNVNDNFYFGFNLGMPSIKYSESLNQHESAVNFNDFEIEMDGNKTFWKEGRQRFTLNANGSGIYAKAGFIWLPTKGLRIGAAIQSPTLITMNEEWMWDADCVFTHDSFSGETPEGRYSYNITTPFSYSLGAAYTFANRGLISVDWERMDFKSMRFSEVESNWGSDPFEEDNRYIKNNAGVTNHLRIGAELLLTDALSLRAGYNFKNYRESSGVSDATRALSCGLGYSSPRSFFCDFSLRYTRHPDTWFYPYENYIDDTPSPEVALRKRTVDALVTFGWRF